MGVSKELWETVYQRDEGTCIARRLAPDNGPCSGKWGDPVRFDRSGWARREDLTFAHIKMQPGGPRVDDERHAVMACWGHHVFGDMWVTNDDNLELVRYYLRDRYGYDYD